MPSTSQPPFAEPHLPSSPTAIHHLFEARAAERPDAPAVVHHGAVTTYGELNARANRVARRLRALGAGPETVVGVHLPRTPDLVATLLGVLKAGAAYVPLDPAYPPERVAFMVGDTRIRVLVTTSALAGRLPEHGAAALVLDREAEALAALDGGDLDVRVERENLAYVIYTSGSTGQPKGVQIEHRGTLAVLGWLKETLGDEERDGVLASTSIAFDVSIAEIFGTLCWGGRLVLVENALSLAAIGDGVRTVCMVPSAAAELLRIGGIPACVRTLALGGEPLRNDLAQRLFALGHVDRVLNLYGPTEDTTYSTCKEVERGRTREMTVGEAVTGTEVHVLDASGGEIAHGAEGEIWMAGRGLARGYAGQPAMTAERFVPDPHSGVPGARMYRTGDLGRFLPDGDLECLGRIDHQVKVRGYRVEPGEIETVLARHPALAEAVVAPWDDRGTRRLAAYYVPASGEPSAAELRDFLRARLPAYMVPEAWVRLDVVPHTPNGKVDRLALPKPTLSRAGSAEYVAPSTPDEEALAAIWAEVLGMDEVGVRDDFFEVGGHSLLAVRMLAAVEQMRGRRVPLAWLFESSTIEALAARIGADVRGEVEPPVVTLPGSDAAT
ncbi:MAG TPA: non-ribosomal peptide synthetase, partial [Longimicrobium sp.]|nr:non-ribosomal peptide synthetase [Longimicrobium sp.]